jgi:RNA-directed DNA polymerase
MRREFHVRFCEGPGVQFPRATRLVICFERADDAQRVWRVLGERFKKFGLSLHPKKTRSFPFQAPRDGTDSGGATFDFLGFTLHWQRARKPGTWRVAFRTRGARFRRTVKAATEWCRRHRHDPVKEQHLALTRKLNGHYSYFGVNGNIGSLRRMRHAIERVWQKWLNRRSQRARMYWNRFQQLLKALSLPEPKIKVQIWGSRESIRQKSRMV